MIVCLSTATSMCILRVVRDGIEHAYDWEAGRELASSIHGRMLDAVGDFHSISGLVVYEGPGSFTGLRIGITVANTLADSLHIPIVGVTGEDWIADGIQRLNVGENDQIVMPEYGSEAHITTQKK